MKKIFFSMVIAIAGLLFAAPVFAGHFETPAASMIQMHVAGDLIINGKAAMPGDEVSVFDSNGRILGAFTVQKEGIFGDMVINGDYEATAEVEGAKEGEDLSVKVWQQSSKKEYSGNRVKVVRPLEAKAIYTPFEGDAFRFADGTFYLLNVEAK